MRILIALAAIVLALAGAPLNAFGASAPLSTLPVNSSPIGSDCIADAPADLPPTVELECVTLSNLATWMQTQISGLPDVASGHTLCNLTGSSAAPTDESVSACLDYAFGSTQGEILYRGASGWSVLAPGTSGEFLESLGGGANPQWAAAGGGDCTPSASAGDAKAPGCIGIPQSGGAFKTANYTTTASDVGGEIVANCSGPCTVMVATNASVPVAVGQVMDITNVGSAADTISSSDTLEAASAGTIVTGSVSLPVGATAFLHKIATTTWMVTGAPANGLTQIAQVVTTSGATSITFSSIPATYTNLEVRLSGGTTKTGTGGNDTIVMQINSDSSSHYYFQYNQFIGGSGVAGAQGGNPATSANVGVTSQGGETVPMSSMVLDINGYASTTFAKMFSARSGFIRSSSMSDFLFNGYWTPASAITSLVFTLQSGDAWATGTVATLYGIP